MSLETKMKQRELRILTVSPPAEPRPNWGEITAGIVPVAGGGHVLIGVDPVAVRHVYETVVEVQREMQLEREGTGCIVFADDAAKEAAFRQTLKGFAVRSAPAAMVVAGRMLVEHGDDARSVLFFARDDDVGAPRERVDELLARAGVPPGGELL